jgi:hypothetical protein
MNVDLKSLLQRNQQQNEGIGARLQKKKPVEGAWKHDKFEQVAEAEEEYNGGPYLVEIKNLHWNVQFS